MAGDVSAVVQVLLARGSQRQHRARRLRDSRKPMLWCLSARVCRRAPRTEGPLRQGCGAGAGVIFGGSCTGVVFCSGTGFAAPPSARPRGFRPSALQSLIEVRQIQLQTFGAIGSNLPNFNQRLQTDGQPESSGTGAASSAAKPVPEQKTTPVQEPPKITPAPRPATPSPSGPSVLGARPQTRTETPAAKPSAPAVSQPAGPVLPLGAPRKKTSSPPAEGSGDSRP